MLTILRKNGFRFFFYSAERSEPPHVHVMKGDGDGKIWLEPDFEQVFLHGFTKAEEKKLLEIAFEYRETFRKQWHEYFS